jgi:glutaredoxin
MASRIILYTQPACAPCDQVTALLSEKGLDYETRDVSADPQALKELTDLGFMATPVTLIDGEAVVGFNRRRLEALLRRQG